MGLLKKLIIGLFLLVVIGAVAVYGIQYYYLNAYDRVLVEGKTETVSGDVFYLSNVLEPGKYYINANSEGAVEKITLLDESGNVLTESETNNMVYGSSQPFQVRVDYKAPVGVDSYEVKIEIYRLVEK